jgi:hypothetical protein
MGTIINAIIKGQTELLLMPEQPKQDQSGDYYYDFMPTGARLLTMTDLANGLFTAGTRYLLMQSNNQILECHRLRNELSDRGRQMIETNRVYIYEQYIKR